MQVRSFITIHIACILCMLSCNRGMDALPHPSADEEENFLLKEIALQGLPSPYLQFIYNTNSQIHRINQESNLYQYELFYQNGKLSAMINKANMDFDSLQYLYLGERVVKINRSNISLGKIEEVNLKYDASGRLAELEWIKLATGEVFKKLTIQYGAGDNMNKYEEYHLQAGILFKTGSHSFNGFDDNINTAPNLILKDIHYLHLPGIRLHKNNPAEEIITGQTTDSRTEFSCQFQNSLPVSKLSIITVTRGPEKGRVVKSLTSFSYHK